MVNKFILMILVSIGPGFIAFAGEAVQTPAKPDAILIVENKAFFKKAHALYYNYRRLGLHRFQCRVKEEVWEDFKENIFAPLNKLQHGFSLYETLTNYKKMKSEMSEEQRRKWNESTMEIGPKLKEMFDKQEDSSRGKKNEGGPKNNPNGSAGLEQVTPPAGDSFDQCLSLLDQIANMQYFLSYSEKEDFRYSHTIFKPIGISVADQDVESKFDSFRAEVLLFSKVWGDFTTMTMPDAGNGPSRLVTKTEKGYTVEITSANGKSVFFLTDKLLLSEAKLTLPPEDGGDLNMKFSFNNTPRGFLAKSISFTAKKETVKGKIEVEYDEVDHFRMPKNFKWEYQTIDKNNKHTNFHDSLELFDYRIN